MNAGGGGGGVHGLLHLLLRCRWMQITDDDCYTLDTNRFQS
jgi:hypothetical protein